MINPAKLPQADLLAEQFIPDHVFVYIEAGTIRCYDGSNTYAFGAGQCCLARKNRLAKYRTGEEGFAPLIFCFEEAFLRSFGAKHGIGAAPAKAAETFIPVETSVVINSFIHSLAPYRTAPGKLQEAFEDLKYEELLLILLQEQPALAGILFDFGKPDKIDLEAFMNRNFTFNVGLDRFAFLTGRSLSAFKRDFRAIFGEAPGRWLLKRRLQEAYYLIDQEARKPADIYLDLGFEALPHFSFAFKKEFGITPGCLRK